MNYASNHLMTLTRTHLSPKNARSNPSNELRGRMAQGYEGWWVPRSLARQQLRKHMGDTGIMDYMLKAVANSTVGPWAVLR